MQAAIYHQYGPPEVVRLAEVEQPRPRENEVLIRVGATTVKRTDCGFRSAEYVVSRLFSGLLRPKRPILGNEFAGVIEAVGAGVSNWQVGERVFGYNDATFGAHAQYLVLPAAGALAAMPAGLTFEEAAPITEGAHYALGNLRAARVGAGHRVLVNGATGGIGSAAVQLARYFGARVTAVCAGPHLELVRSLGADRVIDYTREDFTQLPEQFDLVFDAVGKSSFGRCRRLLPRHGVYISTELGRRGDNVFRALAAPLLRGPKVLFPLPSISAQDVQLLKELVEAGHFRPLIDRRYPLAQIVEAHRYVETGQKIGNVVISLNAQ
ncbi:NAD(P)-dependent alcohol dehydrogenase [Hymenobacter sp. B81]|uniref:NAD(P)-dependent alcohol dehydrogenase n=1 Tax=Hymenobacter sp. B81 TaxID=3344878 RepID=UPI0037DD15C3